ncbi:NAD(+)--dinitrogen-reductase ADP-D-ribosyltransferase [Geomesophilobacter sediminis]|uniref:NAD(+)--dinitrogen-reductase ADP-D-ribosyltransferase n=1 Tax=Geomesophilobacter sediminis TaxID=2798584 RepID=A0A8J7LZD9_9BACT|nr:NAD(+)--dinitrogen-reductase ADP-D-ribosyltransferase [Geomesophilobacter sediminis]MBJ6726256.1 NAD(+)--dinitrogen-reductase ADP-D-ribosyltransferase [Geomesophilobacter sediminis]
MENSFNQCNLPPWVIASRHFNDNPQPLHIQGVRLANRFLFDRLDSIASAVERAEIFDGYMSVKFQLHQWQDQTPTARKSLKNSYLRFLRGWMMDSNSVEGAVLKGWVESRIGLPPTFHNERIPDSHSEQYMKYAVDRTKGSARTSAINSQLDLLYEYCQYELQKRYPDRKTLTLYRGTFERSEHDVLEVVSKREEIVRLNNLNSFTTDEERAWEFGFIVWKVEVPLEKIFFFSELLPTSILKGEGECLVIGGDYRVRKVACTI